MTSDPFTVLTFNLHNGEADPFVLASLAAQADVVVLVETTAAAQVGLAAHGWDERFPNAVGDPRSEGSNTAVFSRFRLSRGTLLGRSNFSQWSVGVEVPDIGLVRLFAVHPCNPYCGNGRWHTEHEVVRAAVVAHGSGPLVMAGDFNAVAEQGPMQRLHRLGLRSTTDLAGAGWLPTYPGRPTPAAAAADRPCPGQRPADGDVRDSVHRAGIRPPRSAGEHRRHRLRAGRPTVNRR